MKVSPFNPASSPHINSPQAMDDDFTEVLLRLNSSDGDFNFILQAIKTRMNKILKQDGYFERVVSLSYTMMTNLDRPEIRSVQQSPGRPSIPDEK